MPSASTSPTLLRFGILGAARIGPEGLIKPARDHPEATVTAVACRDPARGAQYAKKWGIPKVYSGPKGYHELIADPDVDAVYVALPNGLHYEWTMRALQAGKHVLIEKPITSTADEARQIFALAEEKGLVALEAMHSTFHPATQRVREIVLSGELGKVKSAEVMFRVPTWMTFFIFEKNDVRYKYDLAGGCSMDMGVYSIDAIRYATGNETTALEVTSATATPHPADPTRIDRAMHATYALPAASDSASDSVTVAETTTDWAAPGWGPFGLLPRMPVDTLTVRLERGAVELYNFVSPHLYHHIAVRPTGDSEGAATAAAAARTEKVYRYADGRGGVGWTTYRYQLEAFVDRIRGRTPWVWIEPMTSVTEMETVERVYAKSGLPPRRSPPCDFDNAAPA